MHWETKKFIWLTYYPGLKLNPQYLQGMPIVQIRNVIGLGYGDGIRNAGNLE